MIPKLKNVFDAKTMVLLFLTIFFGILCVYGLRSNYKTMTELRSAVEISDKQNKNIESALQNLREHVHSHMNTSLTSGKTPIKPPIQLKYSYERLQASEAKRVKVYNQKVTVKAESICGARYPAGGYNPPRVACIQDYVGKNSITENPIPDSLYKFDFISPKWSADLAGISLILTIIFFIFFISSILKNQIKKRYFN